MKEGGEMGMKGIYLAVFVLSLIGCGHVPVASSESGLIKEGRFQGKLKIGMTREQVKAGWGMPDKIINKQGRDFDEIWIYVPHWKFKNYLYFKDGILIRGNPNPENLV